MIVRIFGLSIIQIFTLALLVSILFVLDKKAKCLHTGAYLGYLVWVAHLMIFYGALCLHRFGYLPMSPLFINSWSNALRLHVTLHILGSLILEGKR